MSSSHTSCAVEFDLVSVKVVPQSSLVYYIVCCELHVCWCKHTHICTHVHDTGQEGHKCNICEIMSALYFFEDVHLEINILSHSYIWLWSVGHERRLTLLVMVLGIVSHLRLFFWTSCRKRCILKATCKVSLIHYILLPCIQMFFFMQEHFLCKTF